MEFPPGLPAPRQGELFLLKTFASESRELIDRDRRSAAVKFAISLQ